MKYSNGVSFLTSDETSKLLKHVHSIMRTSKIQNGVLLEKSARIVKSISYGKFSDHIRERMGLDEDHKFTMQEMRSFVSKNDLSDQIGRFNVPAFSKMLNYILVPEFLDSIFDQLDSYRVYTIRGSKLTFYINSIRGDYEKIIGNILDIYVGMENLVEFEVTIDAHIFLTDLPKKSNPLNTWDVQTINSGMTSGDTIFIWRLEEVSKVFIHEMIHLLNLDMGDGVSRISANDMMKNSKIRKRITTSQTSASSLSESFTETMTKIIYTMTITDNDIHDFEREFAIQTNWAMKQCAIVLLLDGNKSIGDELITISQETYMYEYYILHALLMFNIRKTREYGIYLNFSVQNSFHKMKVSHLATYIASIDPESFIREINKIMENVNVGKRTLRMTPYEQN